METETWTCPFCRGDHSPERCEDSAELEELEAEIEATIHFMDDDDYEGLVSHLEGIAAKRPDDPLAQRELGEAYLLNGQPERALELLAGVHGRHPHNEDVHYVILDALYSLGRDESHFRWQAPVSIQRLDELAVDACCAYLLGKGKPAEVRELYTQLLLQGGYLTFTEAELGEALRRDGRFVVEGWAAARAWVRRKRRGERPAGNATSTGSGARSGRS